MNAGWNGGRTREFRQFLQVEHHIVHGEHFTEEGGSRLQENGIGGANELKSPVPSLQQMSMLGDKVEHVGIVKQLGHTDTGSRTVL